MSQQDVTVTNVRVYRGEKIPAWLAPVIEEHTPEWAR